MVIIRWFVGKLVLLFEKILSPVSVQRDAEAQAKIDAELDKLTLYQFQACPFCVKVRIAMKRLALPVRTKDAMRNDEARSELLAGGGRIKVPCLKIEDDAGNETWMYESSDIIAYLNKRFA